MSRQPITTFLRPRALQIRLGPSWARRPFHTTAPSRSSLFNLGGLANSRESQYLSAERGIPRTEFSSNTHLIRSGEVDPFTPAPGASGVAAALHKAQSEHPHPKSNHKTANAAAAASAASASSRGEAVGSPAADLEQPPPLDFSDPYTRTRTLQAMATQLRDAREEVAALKETTAQLSRRDNFIALFVMTLSSVGLSLLCIGIYVLTDTPGKDTIGDRINGSVYEARVAAARGEPIQAGRTNVYDWLIWAPGPVGK